MSPFFTFFGFPQGEAAARRRLMRGSLIVIARQWMAAANPPLIRPSAAFSLRAKSRLRRLRSDTRLRAQPLGGRHFLLVQSSRDNSGQRDGVDLRLEGIAAAGQDGGDLGAGQDAAVLAVGGMDQRLVDEVARLDVGEQQDIRMAGGRAVLGTLVVGSLGVDGNIHGQGGRRRRSR